MTKFSIEKNLIKFCQIQQKQITGSQDFTYSIINLKASSFLKLYYILIVNLD